MNARKLAAREKAWLRISQRPPEPQTQRVVRAVDLFCGCGGMTLGLWEAARRLDALLDVRLAVDADFAACRVFKSNFRTARVRVGNVSALFDRDTGCALSAIEAGVARGVGHVDILLGGPPCQGHSDLNNHTRRRDPKNGLYLRMARAAEVIRPAVVVIENVPAVQRDTNAVVAEACLALEKSGYVTHGQVIDLSRLGVPQRRRRFILLAVRDISLDPIEILSALAVGNGGPERNLRWAIGDLATVKPREEIDSPSAISAENRRRMEFLFENELHDLPNPERPACHRDDDHSYKSMYGRLWWNRPAQTITTGFTSMGQGRYVHPSLRRTLTPHEAARLQTFPDWFNWWPAAGRRTSLATLIGNAVPPLMMMSLGELLIPQMVS